MCGITGFYASQNIDVETAKEALLKMTGSIFHRGPDDGGIWIDQDAGIALGHRRLSILDLSPEGSQPMVSASGRFITVYNGEIYNYADIKNEIERQGFRYPYRGRSDTEVMLAAIEAWGLETAVKKFVGMFSIAVWDRKDRALYFVRDRLGEKPLYYGWMGNTFLFGSELKALRQHPDFRAEIDRDSLALFMRHGYVPAPYTIFKHIHKLPPGCILTLGENKELTINSYWSAKETAEKGIRCPYTGSEPEAVLHLEKLLRESVRMQMVADVPVGAFLSGGVDSSAVVAVMQAESKCPVKTFTIGFHEEKYNEAQYAKVIARHLGTDHTELYVTWQQAMDVIPKLPSLYDEPFADSSQIPTFLVSQLARQLVTVSLSGDGGDELFGGYDRYAAGQYIWDKLRKWPWPIRQGIARIVTAMPEDKWDGLIGFMPGMLREKARSRRIHNLAELFGSDSIESMYQLLVSQWKKPEKLVLASKEPLYNLNNKAEFGLPTVLHKMMYFDMVNYLPDDILVKVDRASMGVSLESRIPLLDHRIVEFAWSLPLSMRFDGNETKRILRQVLYKFVPKEMIERPKMGFGVPIDIWLRGPLREWGEGLLNSRRLSEEGFLNPETVETAWTEHQNGTRDWQYYLWNILMFQAWLNETLD